MMKVSVRIGWILFGLAVLFLTFDSVGKLRQLPQVVEGTTALGYPATVIVPLGILQFACLLLLLVPRTSLVGALLLTGYLGGAIATHVRLGNPLFTHVLFPTYVASLVWGSLYLLDPRLRILTGPRGGEQT